LFSRDTLPPSCLIVPLGYHGTDQKPPPKTSFTSGTSPLDLVGSGGAYFHQRRTTDAAHHPRPMTTIQVVINGNQVEGQIDDLAKILSMVSDIMAQPISNTLKEELLPFNQFAIQELTPYLGQELTEKIINKLEKCANSNYPDFRYFIGMYRELADNIEHRQLVKTLSAIYRFKFGRYMYPESAKCALKSEIKYATICPHCGAVANAFVQRLVKEGLWK